MRPEEIQNHDFLVGLRGYDKDAVRSFLARVASEHATLLAELDDARTVAMTQAPSPVEVRVDDFENLGTSVAAVLRAAKESARELVDEAEERRLRAIEAAEETLRQAHTDAEQIRAEAQTSVADAGAEADRIVREAAERARRLDVEAEARLAGLNDEAARREAAARTRLLEASDEIQLALVALGEPTPPETVDLRDEQAPALG